MQGRANNVFLNQYFADFNCIHNIHNCTILLYEECDYNKTNYSKRRWFPYVITLADVPTDSNNVADLC